MTPFRIPFTNFVAVVAQYAILVTFMAALVLETDSLEKFGLDDFMLGLLLSLVNGAESMRVTKEEGGGGEGAAAAPAAGGGEER